MLRRLSPFAFALLLAGSLALAEGTPPKDAQPADGAAAEEPKTQARTIFDFKSELNLTDDQVAEIKKLLAELSRTIKMTNANITLLNYQIEDLIKAEGDLKEIKAKLDEEAKLRAEARFGDVVCSRNINKVLSESQLAAWNAIKDKARTQKDSGDPKNK